MPVEPAFSSSHRILIYIYHCIVYKTKEAIFIRGIAEENASENSHLQQSEYSTFYKMLGILYIYNR